MPEASIHAPEPSLIERRCAAFLERHDKGSGGSRDDALARIARVSHWSIGLAALAGIVSGGLIGGGEVWLRSAVLDDLAHTGWRETWRYWAQFYLFVGVVSLVEIAALYALTLRAAARITTLSGLSLSQDKHHGLLLFGLARAALEFPNPQMQLFGLDPYARVSNWKLTAINIAYKVKVGVSSFLLRVLLRRVVARVAVRGLVPLLAGPLYAAWNAYISIRVMRELRLRSFAPLAVDHLIDARFTDAAQGCTSETGDLVLEAAGEMLLRGRDAHSNQIYLVTRLAHVFGHEGDIAPDRARNKARLARLDAQGQACVLDVMTLSCLIGSRVHPEQMALLAWAVETTGARLQEDRLKRLRKRLLEGAEITAADLAGARQDAASRPTD